MFLICMKAGDPVGWLRIHGINREKSKAWLTYFALDRRYWGRGFGTDALKTVLETFLKEQEVNTVFLETFPDNKRAMGCYLKCGFKAIEKVWRGEGEDMVEMLRMKWQREPTD